VESSDLEVRNATYAHFVEFGRAPTAADVASTRSVDVLTVREAWKRLHLEHAIVLDDAGELLMANPFSAVPTPFRVVADGRSWDANCAWDAIGICAALHCGGRIETTCADCDEAIVFRITNAAPTDRALLFHCLVPAAHWWDDIAFT
jgi:hypothetical protein